MRSFTLQFPRIGAIHLLILAAFFSATSAFAWPWNSKPQPLLEGRNPIKADAGSPLAWDQGARRLWFVDSGKLQFAQLTTAGFKTRSTGLPLQPDAGILVHPGLHCVFYVDRDGIPHVGRRRDREWAGEKLGEEPISRWLAIDSRRHVVFAYDPAAQGIRSYTYDAKSKSWNSEMIAEGLGEAGDGGAFDAVRRVLYTTHAEADAAVPRHSGATPMSDRTVAGSDMAWPLVRTAWTADGWKSQVLDETGTPQQPAVRGSDGRVFYAKRDDTRGIHFFQPGKGNKKERIGRADGWAGTDTFEDHDDYRIKRPQLPQGWSSYTYLAFVDANPALEGFVIDNFNVHMEGPITIVPVYEPLWEEELLEPHLDGFRAVINPRQGRLIQQRLEHQGEQLRVQIGTRKLYLYRDKYGNYANSITAGGTFSSRAQNFPELDASFDIANPPEEFSQLSEPGAIYYVNSSFGRFSLDPDAPFLPAEVRLPKLVQVTTFGHSYRSPSQDQRGARYRRYQNFGTSYAAPSGLAVDPATGVTFYTQAASPAETENIAPPQWENMKVGNGFVPEPDPKLAPKMTKVWIVMVY